LEIKHLPLFFIFRFSAFFSAHVFWEILEQKNGMIWYDLSPFCITLKKNIH